MRFKVWKAKPGPGSVFHAVVASMQLWWAAGDRLVFPWESERWTHLYCHNAYALNQCLTNRGFVVLSVNRNVPFTETVTLVEELRKRKVEFEQLVFPDEVHSFLTFRYWLEAYTAAAEFLERKLKRSSQEVGDRSKERGTRNEERGTSIRLSAINHQCVPRLEKPPGFS